MDILRQFGDFSLAYSTAVQSGLQHFCSPCGYLAYRQHWRYTYVLGDPVAPPEEWSTLIDGFLERFPKAVFCQISTGAAEQLVRHRYWINELGVDTRLDLETYDFRGKDKEGLRYAENWLRRRDFRFEEHAIDSELSRQMRQLCAAWHQTRVMPRDVVFLNRPIIFEDEIDVRKFFLWDASGTLQAFLFFDPLYRDGETTGYVTSVKRRRPEAPSYAELGLTKWAIDRFREEGKQIVRLGLSPLAGIENKRFRHVGLMHWSFRYGLNAWWVNRFFYNLRGHAAFKQRFKGVEEKMHFASPVYINDFRILGMLRMMRVL
jgi:phosphatidylglycerol lysyltransferase